VRLTRMSATTAACVMMIAGTALAQEERPAAAAEPSTVASITPFVAVGSPTASRVGTSLLFQIAPRTHVEAEVGYRGGDGAGASVSAGLLYDLPNLGRVTPYVAAGVGLDEYGTAVGVPGGLVISRAVAFTVNAGGGLRVPIDRQWGWRTDARWSNGLGRNAPEKWRVYNGISLGSGR
jgi:hypothetical protein